MPSTDWETGVIKYENVSSDDHSVRLLFLGDLCPAGSIAPLLIENSSEEVFGGLAKIIKRCDFSVVNLEAPITKSSEGIKKSGALIKSSIDVSQPLSNAGIKSVSLANNHILDYDQVGLCDTIAALEKVSIKYVGAGLNELAACQPLAITVGKTPLIIHGSAEAEFSAAAEMSAGACDHANRKSLEATKDGNNEALKIAIFHGGREYQTIPPPHTYSMYRKAIVEGYDLVIGHHSHVPQGIDMIEDSIIAYGLGNLLFDSAFGQNHPLWDYGYAVELIASGNKISEILLHPYKAESDRRIALLEGAPKRKFLDFLKDVSYPILNPKLVRDNWRTIAKTNAESKELLQLSQGLLTAYAGNSRVKLIKALWWLLLRCTKSIMKRSRNTEYVLNMLSTESHRELILETIRHLLETETY